MEKIFLVFCVVGMWAMVNGERPLQARPQPIVKCNTAQFMDMAGCVDFVSDGSKVEKPSSDCCHGVEEIVKVDPSCLCQALQFAKDTGIALNMTKAQQLPSACGISTNPKCPNSGAPPSPVPSKPPPPPHHTSPPPPSQHTPPKPSPSPTPRVPVPPPPVKVPPKTSPPTKTPPPRKTSPPAPSPAQSSHSSATSFSISSAVLLVSLAIATYPYL